MAPRALLRKAFGTELRQLRTTAGISQEELAFRAELDRSYISILERGIKSPSLDAFFRLCAALDCRPEIMIARLGRRIKKDGNYPLRG